MPILPKLSSSTPQLPPAATGLKQTIQARSGTAAFVPKGHTLTIINTYGRQVVDFWAFALHAVPTEQELEEEEMMEKDFMKVETEESDQDTTKNVEPENAEDKKTEDKKEEVTKKEEVARHAKDEETAEEKKEEEEAVAHHEKPESPKKDDEKSDSEETVRDKDETQQTETEEKHDAEAVTEQPSAEVQKEEKTPSRWTSFIPSMPGKKQTAESGDTDGSPKTSKGWSAYIPSVPSVRGNKKEEQQPNGEKETRTWASYIPSGHGFSSYIPKDTLSSIKSMHRRDPTKSVAEQVYDFSKTPAGAAGLSMATGSGYAGSIYAAYAAYNRTNATLAERNGPGMEFLSMEHTRSSTQHISPRVGDLLVSNLRAPMITLLYDTSPGAHDTLMAACDPTRYKQLGVEKWAEHGSCAENLVLSLQELNKSVGLKGRKAIGCDVSINNLPAPLNLFMNIPFTRDGDLSFEPPKGKRGDFVKFRAERDLVAVMSACPQDILEINGKKPMVAHFVVNSPTEEDSRVAELRDREAQEIIEKARRRMELEGRRPSLTGTTTPKALPMSPSTESQPGLPKYTPRSSSSSVPRKPSTNPPKLEYRASSGMVQKATQKPKTPTRKQSQPVEPSPSPMKKQPVKFGRNKPRKLERRASTAPTTPKA